MCKHGIPNEALARLNRILAILFMKHVSVSEDKGETHAVFTMHLSPHIRL